MSRAEDERFMRRAMALAREGDRRPGGSPIGRAIVLDGGVLARECASLYYGPDDNPSFEEQTNL